MLQVVLGLDAARIAAALLVPPTTLGQRLVRAKLRVKKAGVPFTIPAAADLPERSAAVLDAIYAAYSTGWEDPDGRDPRRAGLTDEAVRLAGIVVELLPDDAEAHGLLALLLHSRARLDARRDRDGRFVPLGEQDSSRWRRADVERAERHLTTALSLGVLGRYQLHAAIQSVHNRRAATGSTDWPAIRRLYDGLVALDPSPGALVARAAAVAEADGATAGRDALESVAGESVTSYQPYWVLRAELARREGRPDDGALERALTLTTDPAVATHLRAHHER